MLGKDGENMTTLKNLYYGNSLPLMHGSEYDVTAKLVIRHEQELSATLTERQNAILQKVKDNHTELIEPRRARRVCPRFFISGQADNGSYEQ